MGSITYYDAHSLRNLGKFQLDYYANIPSSAVFKNNSTGKLTCTAYNLTRQIRRATYIRGMNLRFHSRFLQCP